MKKMTLVFCLWLAAPVIADHHDGVAEEVKAAVVAFNAAYESNDYDAYFGFYTEDSTLFFYGARADVGEYYDEWKETIEAGGGVDQYVLSDIQVRVMPGNEAAVATYFIAGTLRSDDGPSKVDAFETDVWQKIDGEWKVVSLHYSEH